MPKQTIRLEQTDTEYLLFIKASQKERARRIEGRNWDPDRKCWVYPRTVPIYRSLMAEFGDELEDSTLGAKRDTPEAHVAISVTDRSVPSTSDADSILSANDHSILVASDSRLSKLEEQNELLRAELVKTQRERDKMNADLQTLRAELDILGDGTVQATNATLADLRRKLKESEQLLVDRKDQAKQHNAEIASLHAQLATEKQELVQLKKQLAAKQPNNAQQIVKLAVAAAQGSPQFKKLLQNKKVDAQLPLLLNGHLTTVIEGLLPPADSSDSLGMMLKAAQARHILTDEQLDLAHIIRKQRNVVAHVDLPESSVKARALITLFAAALLWPELTAKN